MRVSAKSGLVKMKNFKQIVQEIQKMAQVPTRSKGPKLNVPGAQTTPSKGTSKPAPGKSTSFISPNKNIVEMQNAIKELATSVIRDSNSSTMPIKTRDAVVDAGEDSVKKGKKAFNDFIAEQYIGPLDPSLKGVEWDANDDIRDHASKKQTETDIYELDAVMNTLNKIGGEKSEFKVDGDWGFRTDNALKNILGFTYSLLQLQGDFGLNNKVYDHTKWEQFKNLVSGYKVENGKVKLSPQDKNERAAKIVEHLNGITKLYDDFRKQILAKPEFRPFIEGQRNFDKYPGSSALTPEDKSLANSNQKLTGIIYFAPKIKGSKLDYIPLKALTSKQEYLKWMADAGLDEAKAISVFNNVIKPRVGA